MITSLIMFKGDPSRLIVEGKSRDIGSSRGIQRVFKEYSRGTQRVSKEYSRGVQGVFKGFSRSFQCVLEKYQRIICEVFREKIHL